MEPSPSQTSLETSKNWLELPPDVTLTILAKLGTFEILETAQLVCKSWYKLCKDPSLWRFIDLNLDVPQSPNKHECMLCNAVDRSSGGLVSLDIEGFGSDENISYLAARSSQLKRLRLACCYNISADALMEAFKNLPVLEELELTLCSFTEEKTIDIIRCCPLLKTFKLNERVSRFSVACDGVALAIAENMRDLCHLQLIGNTMTSEGLKAILDCCSHLQSLDLRACFLVFLDEDLEKRCAQQIKDFRRPNDPTDDYVFHTTEYDSDFDDIYIDEYDPSFMSDDEDYAFSDEDGFPYYAYD